MDCFVLSWIFTSLQTHRITRSLQDSYYIIPCRNGSCQNTGKQTTGAALHSMKVRTRLPSVCLSDHWNCPLLSRTPPPTRSEWTALCNKLHHRGTQTYTPLFIELHSPILWTNTVNVLSSCSGHLLPLHRCGTNSCNRQCQQIIAKPTSTANAYRSPPSQHLPIVLIRQSKTLAKPLCAAIDHGEIKICNPYQ